jgi:vacuolar-type H+-ATPase subunit F/Vma7
MDEPCAVFVSEDLASAAEVSKLIASFRRGKARAVLVVPSMTTTPGKRLAEIRSLIARALGVDLLGRDAEAKN